MKKNAKPRIAVVIACRLNSTRLFAKPLQLVGKSTILDLCIKQIRKAKLVDDIILAISNNPGNEIFVKFAKERKVKFALGDEIDVLKRLIDSAKKNDAKIIVRATSENPFLYGEGIDPLIKKHMNQKYDLSYLGGLPLGVGVEVVNLEALELSHKLGNKRHREHCTMYIHENPSKFKIFRLNPIKELNRPELRLTVDTPEDLIVARVIHEQLQNKNNTIISLKKIIKFLDKNQKIKKLNSDIIIKYKRKDL